MAILAVLLVTHLTLALEISMGCATRPFAWCAWRSATGAARRAHSPRPVATGQNLQNSSWFLGRRKRKNGGGTLTRPARVGPDIPPPGGLCTLHLPLSQKIK